MVGHGRKGKGKGYTKTAPSQEVLQLAAEIAAGMHAANTYSGRGKGAGKSIKGMDKTEQRRPDWGCECGTRNFTDRSVCRSCSKARSACCKVFGPDAAPPMRATAADSVQPQPKTSPNLKAAENAVAAAVAAGLGDGIVANMRLEVEERRSQQTASRPLSRRLQAATDRAKQAKATTQGLKERMEKLQAELATAAEAEATAEKEVG